jgi:hypothetical protein
MPKLEQSANIIHEAKAILDIAQHIARMLVMDYPVTLAFKKLNAFFVPQPLLFQSHRYAQKD